MSRIRAAIADLASEFAEGVLAIIRSASVQEILAETGAAAAEVAARGAKRGAGPATITRASAAPAAMGDVVEQIAALLAQHPKGLRAEEIRAELGIEQKDLPKPIAEALTSKRIVKEGERRATRYFAAAAAPKVAKKKSAKKASAKAPVAKKKAAKKVAAAAARKAKAAKSAAIDSVTEPEADADLGEGEAVDAAEPAAGADEDAVETEPARQLQLELDEAAPE